MGKRGYKLGNSGVGLWEKQDTSYVMLGWTYGEKRGYQLGETGMSLLEKEDAIDSIGKLFLSKCNHCPLLTNFSSIRLANYSETLTSGQLPVLLYVII